MLYGFFELVKKFNPVDKEILNNYFKGDNLISNTSSE